LRRWRIYFKKNSSEKLLIEGHCDERGTEGYNLSLAERRALALPRIPGESAG